MGKTPNIHLDVTNDNGNSEQAMYINGELLRQPNVYAKPTARGFIDNVPAESIIPNLMNQIDVSIQSPSIKFNRRYYIGNRAINSKYKPTTMNVSLDHKYDSDLPIINTVGTLAAKAVQNYFIKNKDIPQKLEVTVDMLTALPVKQWNPVTSKQFASRFAGDNIHVVTVHINQVDVVVNLKFTSVRVTAEGVPALFSLMYDSKLNFNKGFIFRHFKEDYQKEITGEYLLNKRISHIDIGDGTCDMPVTIGFNLDTTHVDGCNQGVGHAIEEAMVEFSNKHTTLTKLTRQKYSEFMKDPNHQYHNDAREFFEDAAMNQAEFIYEHYRNVLAAFDNEVDLIVVYGGGSIALKEALYPLLKEVADKLNKELLWVPEEFAPLMNADGLLVLLNRMKQQQKKNG